MPKRAKVFYADRWAGVLSETDKGYRFDYCADYLAAPDAQSVSLTLPLRAEPFESKVLFPFFDGLIPEGWLLQLAADYWKLSPRNRFDLLLALCRDAIGAVGVEPFPIEENV